MRIKTSYLSTGVFKRSMSFENKRSECIVEIETDLTAFLVFIYRVDRV